MNLLVYYLCLFIGYDGVYGMFCFDFSEDGCLLVL